MTKQVDASNNQTPRTNKTKLILGIILIILGVVGAGYTLWQMKVNFRPHLAKFLIMDLALIVFSALLVVRAWRER